MKTKPNIKTNPLPKIPDNEIIKKSAVDILLNPESGSFSVKMKGSTMSIAALFSFVFTQEEQFFELIKTAVETYERNKPMVKEMARKAGIVPNEMRMSPMDENNPQTDLEIMVEKLKSKKGKIQLN